MCVRRSSIIAIQIKLKSHNLHSYILASVFVRVCECRLFVNVYDSPPQSLIKVFLDLEIELVEYETSMVAINNDNNECYGGGRG